MLTVSAPAKELLRAIEIPDDRGLRLEPVEGGRLGFVAGYPRDDDQVVKESGREVLRIAGAVSQQLDGSSLDRVDTPEGPRIAINRSDEDEPGG